MLRSCRLPLRIKISSLYTYHGLDIYGRKTSKVIIRTEYYQFIIDNYEMISMYLSLSKYNWLSLVAAKLAESAVLLKTLNIETNHHINCWSTCSGSCKSRTDRNYNVGISTRSWSKSGDEGWPHLTHFPLTTGWSFQSITTPNLTSSPSLSFITEHHQHHSVGRTPKTSFKHTSLFLIVNSSTLFFHPHPSLKQDVDFCFSGHQAPQPVRGRRSGFEGN